MEDDPTPFTNMLQNPDSSFEDVILHPYLNKAVKDELQELADFLLIPANFKRLIRYSLTLDFSSHPDFQTLSKRCTFILSTRFSPLQDKLLDDNVILSILTRFLDTDAADNAFICGNFERITEQLFLYSQGDILKEMGSFCQILLQNIEIAPIEYLLIVLLITYPESIPDLDGLIETAVDNIISCEASLPALVRFIEEYLKNDLIKFSQQMILTIFEGLLYAMIHSDSFICFRISELLYFMKRRFYFKAIGKTLEKAKKKIDFSEPTKKAVCGLLLYPDEAKTKIDWIIQMPDYSFMCNAILLAILQEDDLDPETKDKLRAELAKNNHNAYVKKIASKFLDSDQYTEPFIQAENSVKQDSLEQFIYNKRIEEYQFDYGMILEEDSEQEEEEKPEIKKHDEEEDTGFVIIENTMDHSFDFGGSGFGYG